jgi:hypothetical protein
MDIGLDTLVYIIIGIIFVLVQATRKKNVAKGKPQAVAPVEQEEPREVLSDFWKEFLGVDLTANQVSEPVLIDQNPTVYNQPEDFRRIEPVVNEQVHSLSSFNDPGLSVNSQNQEPEKQLEEDPRIAPFDLRSAIIYAAIMERKYV